MVYEVTAEEEGKKVFQVLKKHYPVSFVYKAFRKREVKLNGKRAKEDDRVEKGDTLKVFLPLKKKEMSFDILLDHPDFLVINKPKGIGMHEGKTITFKESLLSRLITFLKPKGITPYLVHRLDFNTSGCLLIAKTEKIAEEFEPLFLEGKIQKTYLALVQGLLQRPSGTLHATLPGRAGGFVPAITSYLVLRSFPYVRVTLLEAGLKTGRKHQIRLHFAGIKHPVVMDQKYGDFAFNKAFQKQWKLRSQFLHAKSLEFLWKEKSYAITAPLPSELEKCLKALKKY